VNKPSLETLIQRAKTTITTKLRVSNPAIDAVAAAIGGGNYGVYGYSDYLFRQLSPETAEEEWLYIWANRFKTPRLDAQLATGTVNFLGAALGTIVPSGLILKDTNDNEYEVTAATSADLPVPIRSMEAGENFNQPAGIELTMSTAVTGLNPDEITTNEITGGSDIEELERWRSRVVLAWRETQVVGRAEDYKIWAQASHPDIGFAWALDNTPQIGFVTTYIGKAEADPTIEASIIQAAEDYIDTQRPGGCHPIVLSPSQIPLAVEISGVTDTQTRTQIEQAIETYIISRMGDREAITPGEIVVTITPITTDFSLVSPTQSLTPAINEVITPGGVTWS